MKQHSTMSVLRTAQRSAPMFSQLTMPMPARLLAGAVALTVATAAGAPASAQTTLDLEARAASGGIVYVLPGATVGYEIVGTLGGDTSEGLAMFAFDLTFSGGDLTQVAAPAAGPIQQFVSPLGFNNPEGYGGTAVSYTHLTLPTICSV